MTDFLDDGTADFSLGQDSWHNPDLIQPNQYARGVNVTTSKGSAYPRPSLHALELEFQDEYFVTGYRQSRPLADIWASGKFQAYVPWVQFPNEYILTVVSGLIFRTNINTLKTELLSGDIRINQFVPRVNWSYALNAVVFFDFPDYPVIVEQDRVYRASPDHLFEGNPAPQVPISTIGAYNQSRLFVGAGVTFTAGDVVGNPLTPEAPLTFIEVLTPSSPYFDQSFSLPTGDVNYPISAMGFIQQLDSSTGVGPLFVATRKSVFFFQTNQPRENWGQGQFGGILLANAGIAGSRAVVNVNSDLLFQSAEGQIHAFSNARNEARKWGNVPISREVQNYLIVRDPDLTQFGTLGYFNNRIFIGANPYRVNSQTRERKPVTDYAHAGLAVLEIDNLASLLQEGTPAWAGLWTGVNPMDMGPVGNRFFIVSKDGCQPNGYNRIYELTNRTGPDRIGRNIRKIRSYIYTRQYNFQSEYVLKEEHTVLLNVQEIQGEFYVKVERRPLHGNRFEKYGEWRYDAQTALCYEMPEDEFLNGLSPQQMRQLIFGDPAVKGCNEVTDELYTRFNAVQLRITLEGDGWSLTDIKMRARPIAVNERQELFMCQAPVPKKAPLQCEPDWTIPEETICR